MAAKPSLAARPASRPAPAARTDDGRQGRALFEMANLQPERTGLPFVVFISQRGGAGHDVRVKVAGSAKVRPSETATVAVRPEVRVLRGAVEPADLALLTAWIGLNRDVLP